MILHYFIKKENNDKDISNEIYLSFMDNLKRLRNWSKHSELAYMASRED